MGTWEQLRQRLLILSEDFKFIQSQERRFLQERMSSSLYFSCCITISTFKNTSVFKSGLFFFFFSRLDEWNQRFGQIQPYIFIFFRRLRAALNTGFWKLVSLHNYKPARQFTIAAQNATGLEWKAAQNLSVLFLDRSPGPWYRRALEPRQDRDLKNSSGFCGPFYMQYDLNQRV